MEDGKRGAAKREMNKRLRIQAAEETARASPFGNAADEDDDGFSWFTSGIVPADAEDEISVAKASEAPITKAPSKKSHKKKKKE